MHPEELLPKPRPAIGWAGGKQRLLKHILPEIPAHTTYCEVFGGGLAVFLARPQSPVEVINDINSELIGFYRCCKYHLDPLLDELDLVMNSREEFEDYRRQPGLTDIQRAARWYIRNRISFGGMGATFAVCRKHALTGRTQRMQVLRALSHRMEKTTIEHVSWERCLDLYDAPETFFFLDPPYLDGAGDAYSGWSEVDLARFCERVAKLEGQWIFTFQDCPQVRSAMAGWPIKAITRANGIGNNGAKRSGRVYREVVITSGERAAARKVA